MPLGDQAFYDRFIRRVTWIILALALTGSAVLAIVKGIRIGLAFLIGATVSYGSFWGWRQLVDALTPGAEEAIVVSVYGSHSAAHRAGLRYNQISGIECRGRGVGSIGFRGGCTPRVNLRTYLCPNMK